MTTRADLERLGDALDEAARRAVVDLDRFMARLDWSQPEMARDALAEVMQGLSARYGDLAATEAAEWFEAVREGAVGSPMTGVLADGASAVQVERATRWAAGPAFQGDAAVTADRLRATLTRFILTQGKETVSQNVARDPLKPRFARVPPAGGCCAWCLMLAGRGFIYGSLKAAGGDGHRYHDHCRCLIAPLWKGQPERIDGYHPKRYEALYKAARAKVTERGDPADASTIAAEMRRLAPETVTDGVTPAE